MKKFLSIFLTSLFFSFSSYSNSYACDEINIFKQTKDIEQMIDVCKIKNNDDRKKKGLMLSCTEKVNYPKFKDRVIVDKSGVKVKLNNGKYKLLKNNLSYADSAKNIVRDDFIKHYFINYLKDIKIYVIYAVLYENEGFILVNASNGEYSFFPNNTIFSPDKKYILVANNSGYHGHNLRIYNSKNFKEEYYKDFGDFSLDTPLISYGWENNNKICLIYTSYDKFKKVSYNITDLKKGKMPVNW